MRQANSLRYAVLPVAIATSWVGWFFFTKAPHWIEQRTDEEFSTLQASTVMTKARVIKVGEHLIGGGGGYAMEYCPTVSFADHEGISHLAQVPCSLNDGPTQDALIDVRYQPTTAKVLWTAAYESSQRFSSFGVSLIFRIIGALCFIGAVGTLQLVQSDR